MEIGTEVVAGPAGYSGTPLIKKLGIKAGFLMHLVNAPARYLQLLGDLPSGIMFADEGPVDFIHLFTKDEDELVEKLPVLKTMLKPNGMIWVSWPKKSSKVACTVTEETVRTFGIETGLVDIKVCAVDDTWSGLKFVIPVKDR